MPGMRLPGTTWMSAQIAHDIGRADELLGLLSTSGVSNVALM